MAVIFVHLFTLTPVAVIHFFNHCLAVNLVFSFSWGTVKETGTNAAEEETGVLTGTMNKVEFILTKTPLWSSNEDQGISWEWQMRRRKGRCPLAGTKHPAGLSWKSLSLALSLGLKVADGNRMLWSSPRLMSWKARDPGINQSSGERGQPSWDQR